MVQRPHEEVPFIILGVQKDYIGLLKTPLSFQEILDSTQLLQNGNVHGPDGFSVEQYKTFAGLLSFILLEAYNESFKNGKLPSFYEAHIRPILKPDKDPNFCASYRPTASINVDTRILTTILAR